ncbi:MAG: LPS export ABC transporter periplasmic protein LptC [Spirochaetota bacterium]
MSGPRAAGAASDRRRPNGRVAAHRAGNRASVCAPTILLAALITLGFASCSIDYGDSQLASEISEDTPDSILFEVRNTVVRDSRPRFIVVADRAETFGDRKRQYLYGVDFQELDAEGGTITEGTAAYAEYQTDTEDIELSGDLRFYSAEEDAWVTAEYLYWDSDQRALTSEPEEPVVIRRGDGTVVRGRGFVAEMGRSTIRFDDGVSGTMIEDEQSEQSE